MTQVGAVLSLPGAAHAELVARHLDFVWIDLEHAALGPAEMQDALVGVSAAGAAAYVRVPAGSPPAVALDAGADGIVFPRIRSVAEAERAVASLRHAPEGSRGYGPRRLAVWPRAGRPTCVAQIEDAAGVHSAAGIAAIHGVDALVLGAADLSFALGEPLAFDTPPLQSALDAVRTACETPGTRFGIAGLPVADAIRAGADLVLVGVDVRLIDCALADTVQLAREALHG
jgi:2-keto-3-deoxy-L-rhamnonate aldolase RhmA